MRRRPHTHRQAASTQLYLTMLQILACLQSLFHRIVDFFLAFFGRGRGGGSSRHALSGKRLTFDNGLTVRIGRQVAEGGFSFVFEAYDADASRRNRNPKKYALKRINCSDPELVQRCREEAGVHRTFDHPNLLPLLGLKFDSTPDMPGVTVCYMLFPFLSTSLRDDITERRLLDDDADLAAEAAAGAGAAGSSSRRPYAEVEVLELFGSVVDAVRTMHRAGLAHRDVKVENVMLAPSRTDYADSGGGRGRGGGGAAPSRRRQRRGAAAATAQPAAPASSAARPVLMDFGSVGPVSYPIKSRVDVLRLTEEAAQHCTMPYRAPELFDGGCRHGLDERPIDGRVDVWSLGCVLFAVMYGSSPFEVEFRSSQQGGGGNGGGSGGGGGTVRIVECTHLRVLGPVPFPPPGSEAAGRYSDGLNDAVRWMLNQARLERPTVDEVSERVDELLERAGGRRRRVGGVGGGGTSEEKHGDVSMGRQGARRDDGTALDNGENGAFDPFGATSMA